MAKSKKEKEGRQHESHHHGDNTTDVSNNADDPSLQGEGRDKFQTRQEIALHHLEEAMTSRNVNQLSAAMHRARKAGVSAAQLKEVERLLADRSLKGNSKLLLKGAQTTLTQLKTTPDEEEKFKEERHVEREAARNVNDETSSEGSHGSWMYSAHNVPVPDPDSVAQDYAFPKTRTIPRDPVTADPSSDLSEEHLARPKQAFVTPQEFSFSKGQGREKKAAKRKDKKAVDTMSASSSPDSPREQPEALADNSTSPPDDDDEEWDREARALLERMGQSVDSESKSTGSRQSGSASSSNRSSGTEEQAKKYVPASEDDTICISSNYGRRALEIEIERERELHEQKKREEQRREQERKEEGNFEKEMSKGDEEAFREKERRRLGAKADEGKRSGSPPVPVATSAPVQGSTTWLAAVTQHRPGSSPPTLPPPDAKLAESAAAAEVADLKKRCTLMETRLRESEMRFVQLRELRERFLEVSQELQTLRDNIPQMVKTAAYEASLQVISDIVRKGTPPPPTGPPVLPVHTSHASHAPSFGLTAAPVSPGAATSTFGGFGAFEGRHGAAAATTTTSFGTSSGYRGAPGQGVAGLGVVAPPFVPDIPSSSEVSSEWSARVGTSSRRTGGALSDVWDVTQDPKFEPTLVGRGAAAGAAAPGAHRAPAPPSSVAPLGPRRGHPGPPMASMVARADDHDQFLLERYGL